MLIPLAYNWGPDYTLLTGTVEYQVIGARREALIDWTNAGVTELVAGSGLYGASIDFDPAWGVAGVEWRETVNDLIGKGETISLVEQSALSGGDIEATYLAFASWGRENSGASPQYTVIQADGTVVVPASSDVSEIPEGSGVYSAKIPFNLKWGLVRILWDGGSGNASAQWLNAAMADMSAADIGLNERQVYRYTQRCDIWRRPPPDAGPVPGTLADRTLFRLVYQTMPWRDDTTRYNSSIDVLGHGDDPNFLTRDDGHFVWWADLRDGDVVIETTWGRIPSETSFVCVGQGERRIGGVGNYNHVDLQRQLLKETNMEAFYL